METEVNEVEGHAAAAHGEVFDEKGHYRKFLVRGPSSPWDAMNAKGVPEAGTAYGPKRPDLVAGTRSAKPLNGDPDDCDEWEVVVRYYDRDRVEARHRKRY